MKHSTEFKGCLARWDLCNLLKTTGHAAILQDCVIPLCLFSSRPPHMKSRLLITPARQVKVKRKQAHNAMSRKADP